MKFKVISHDYRNTGGNTMVSVFQVYLFDENRTVFVNCGENSASITTVDYTCSDFEPGDYGQIIIIDVDFTQGYPADACKYYDVLIYCLYEWIKSDCKHYGYRLGVDFHWLPSAVKMQISELQKDFVKDEMDGKFYTDGYYVYVPRPDDDEDKIPIVANHKTLHDTLAACLGYLTDKLEIDGCFMEYDASNRLRETIADVHYHLYQNN